MMMKKIIAGLVSCAMIGVMSFSVCAAGSNSGTLDGERLSGKSWISGTKAYGESSREIRGTLRVKITYDCILSGQTSYITKTASNQNGATYISVSSPESCKYMLSVSGVHGMDKSGGKSITIYT